MKNVLLIIAAVAVATSAMAGPKTPKPMTCAVMPSHKIDIAKATKDGQFADYKGRRYFFCCGDCKPAFEKDPSKFSKAPSIATPKKK